MCGNVRMLFFMFMKGSVSGVIVCIPLLILVICGSFAAQTGESRKVPRSASSGISRAHINVPGVADLCHEWNTL